jgi:hypothetical protein
LNRPFAPPVYGVTIYFRLADAVHNGADATFALHDALLESGHPELAAQHQNPTEELVGLPRIVAWTVRAGSQ